MTKGRRADLTRFRWYVRANDLVGGYCIMATDAPPSQSRMQVADMVGKAEAARIVTLHNEKLADAKRTKIIKLTLLILAIPVSVISVMRWVSDGTCAALWTILFLAAVFLL